MSAAEEKLYGCWIAQTNGPFRRAAFVGPGNQDEEFNRTLKALFELPTCGEMSVDELLCRLIQELAALGFSPIRL